MNYRDTRSSYLNCEKRIFDGVGDYEFPKINPFDMDIEGVSLIGFNYAMTERHPEDKVCHFFLDDYQFERVWYNPDKYLSVLQRFKAVLSPDFSTYDDFPRAVSIFNHYRKQWCGAYWQENGINVIPTVGWSNPDSYDYCFDGMPRDSLVCVSTSGVFSDKESRERFLIGYRKAMDVLTPKKIIFYGKFFDDIEIPSNVEWCVGVNQRVLYKREYRKRKKEELNGENNNTTQDIDIVG